MIGTLAELKELLQKERIIAFDVETTGLLPFAGSELIGAGFYFPKSEIELYIPIKATTSPLTLFSSEYEAVSEDAEEFKQLLVDIITPNHYLVGHNIKFDLSFLPPLPCQVVDTMVMTHIVNENHKRSLDAVEERYLGTSSKKGTGVDASKITEYPLESVASYCTNDARVTYLLSLKLIDLIKNKENCYKLFKLQMNYLKHILEMERIGIGLDIELGNSHLKAVKNTLKQLEAQLFEEVGESFNWHSPVQLSKMLYERMNIKKPAYIEEDYTEKPWAKSGVFTKTMTSTFVLKERVKHPLADLLAGMRHTEKLIQFLDKLINNAKTSKDKRVHANFNMTGTKTGRLSCSKPNLQNLPGEIMSGLATRPGSLLKDQEELSLEADKTSNIRTLFVAKPEHKLVSFDYKQMEIRMFAVQAKEPNMLRYLNEGKDIHKESAEAVWGIGDASHREWAKSISFGLIYGMGSKSVAFKFQVSNEQAEKMQNKYLSQFPRIKEFLQETLELMEKQQYITYWSGRKRRIEESYLWYRAVNATIQGGSADMLGVAVCRLNRYLQKNNLKSRIVNLVHDEVLLEVPEKEFNHLPAMGEILEIKDIHGLPFTIDCKIGNNWGTMDKYNLA